MQVVKRNGKKEIFDLNKFHKMVEEACDGLNGVSVSEVELNSNIQFYDGMPTKEIQQILIRSANDLISLENPNYQYVAARLLLFGLYKEVYGHFESRSLYDAIKKNVQLKVYDGEILEKYSQEEIEVLDGFIKNKRDWDFTYAGLQQLVDKYLVQDRISGKVFETPQEMYILIAATLFSNYPKEIRLAYIKKYYDAISTHKISLPTPIVSGVRTPLRQYASCVLISVDDTLDSIFSSNTAIGKYTAQRAGIGLDVGRIRGINTKIRGGEVVHTGIIPFLKMFEAATKSTVQNGIRGGCLEKNTQVPVVDYVEIGGKKYLITEKYNGENIIDLINSQNGQKHHFDKEKND